MMTRTADGIDLCRRYGLPDLRPIGGQTWRCQLCQQCVQAECSCCEPPRHDCLPWIANTREVDGTHGYVLRRARFGSDLRYCVSEFVPRADVETGERAPRYVVTDRTQTDPIFLDGSVPKIIRDSATLAEALEGLGGVTC
jgi:hypothetical protein